MMYEDRTYENILAEALAYGEERGVDIRPGEVYYDAITGIISKVAKYYSDLNVGFDMVMRDTATGDYLDRHAHDSMLERNPGLGAWYTAIFEGTTPEAGERFFTDGIYFALVIKDDAFYFVAEQPGIQANSILPGTPAVPVNSIQGLAAAMFGSLYIAGTAEESDDDLRSRIQQKEAGPAENGNKQHYKTWCESVPGVGRARILPLKDGPNTVTGVLLDSNGMPAAPGLVEQVQEAVDPGGTGLGEGLANLGAHFTAVAASSLPLNISFTAVLKGGATAESAKAEATAAFIGMLKAQALDTPDDETVIIRISNIGAILYSLSSILDYSDLLLNGGDSNIEVNDLQVAVLGEVEVDVSI